MKFSNLLRLPLKLIPTTWVLPIVSGILRGTNWIFGSGVAGYWLGIYEKEEQKLLSKIIKEKDVFFDVGANVGFYSLLASKLVGSDGLVVSFEPDNNNFNFLERHVKINNITNIKSFKLAVSDFSGDSNFKIGNNSATGQLVKESLGIKVKTVSLDEFCREKNIYPNFLKIDVEGSEREVLIGAKLVISQKHPFLVVATHSDDLFAECKELIRSFGYEIEEVSGYMQKNRDIVATFRK